MTDEKDPVLTRMFAAEADVEPSPAFREGVRVRIVRLRRRRILALLAVTATIPVAAVLTAPLFASVKAPILGNEALLASPAMMAAGAVLALGLALASRTRMRRR